MEKQNIIFCTYFDKYYLLKGLSMYASLIQYNKDVQLWILCLDEYTKKIIELLKLKNVVSISLDEFEDKELKKVKNGRTKIEYYWTCTPSLPLYIFKKSPFCKLVIYLDADLFFYSSVSPILEELGGKSIFVVEHRFPKDKKVRLITSGRFNVGILAFRKDAEGVKCLKRWRKQCLNWCFFREEKGKMGDQLYLNEWPNLYKNLVISKNLGVNSAPWNINRYLVSKRKDKIYINKYHLICYHFHQFQVIGKNRFSLAYGYKLPSVVKNYIYQPYIREISKNLEEIFRIDPNFNYYMKDNFSLWSKLRNYFIEKFRK